MQVAISCSTPGATLYYTIDGSTPTANSPIYVSPITLTNSAIVRVVGVATGYTQSSEATASVVVIVPLPTVATPVFTPDGGTYTSVVQVAISCSTPGATLHYTTDGSAPTASSTTYLSPIPLSNSVTVNVIGFADAYTSSSVAAASFTINLPLTLTILTDNILPPAVKGHTYSLALQATNGTLPYTWSVSKAATLPAGLKLSTVGLLSGTPTKASTTNSLVIVKDAASHTAQQTFSLTVIDPAPVFEPLAGTYTGLIIATNAPAQSSSGALILVLSKTGTFAGNLTLAGAKTAFRGQFDLTGNATNILADVGMILQVDVAGANGQITGAVTGSGFTSEVLAELPDTSQNWQGYYTLVLSPADATATNVPHGYGYATLTVSRTGSGFFSGTLNDGTKLTARAPVSQSGLWPLYASLYRNTGACVGWVNLATNTAVTAIVDWFAPASPGYAAFATTLVLDGSQYTTGPQPLSGAWGVTLSGGGLVNNIVKAVTLDPAGKVTVLQPDVDALKLTLTLKTGKLTGSFQPTAGSKVISFNGLLLQAQDAGAGLFQTTTGQTGGVTIEPVP